MSQVETEIFKNLEGVLEDEIRIYRSLLDLVRREKEILVAAKVSELEENNKAKEAFILKIKALEKLRERYARELAQKVGAPTETPRLIEIAVRMPDEEATKLRAIHSTLDLLIKRIKEINSSNEGLIQSTLEVVNGTLGAIRDTLQPKQTYAPSGDMKKKEVAGHFVSKDV
jgi:flagellar biosynthesis/type III secretory pathway chaperone